MMFSGKRILHSRRNMRRGAIRFPGKLSQIVSAGGDLPPAAGSARHA
jgi:hypothetical protein